MARKGRTKPILRAAEEPMTPERRRHAGPDGIATGDDGMGGKRHTILSPLDRLHARKMLSPAAYHALAKYRVHFHNAGLEPTVGSVDLNRIFASDTTNFSGMAKNDRQYFHRQQHRKAVQIMGIRTSAVVDRVVCLEQTIEVAGFSLGYASPPRGRAAALVLLEDAGKALAKLWGM